MKADRTKRRCIARQQLIFSIYYPPHKKMRNECCEYGREGGKESGSRREARPTCVQGGAWRHRWLMAVINQPIEFHSVDISLPFPPLPLFLPLSVCLSINNPWGSQVDEDHRLFDTGEGKEEERSVESFASKPFVLDGIFEARTRIIADPSNENSSRFVTR